MVLFLEEFEWAESLDVGPTQPEWGRSGPVFHDAGCQGTRQDSVMVTSGGTGPPLSPHVCLSMCILSKPWAVELGTRTWDLPTRKDSWKEGTQEHSSS